LKRNQISLFKIYLINFQRKINEIGIGSSVITEKNQEK